LSLTIILAKLDDIILAYLASIKYENGRVKN